MISKESLNKELWKEIELHYIKECYTDALKDAYLYLIGLIQSKSEVDDKDGETLINYVFSEKSPKILINNNQTQSEKDEQRGFGYILKGIVCAIRNPISHDKKIEFTKEQCDSILLFINNYILPKLDDSKDFGYVENWFDFIFIKNTDDEERYSDILLSNIPKKDKLKLMLEIIDKIENISHGNFNYFINSLYNSLTKKEQNEVVFAINRLLINENNEIKLSNFFEHFNIGLWSKIDKLARIKIENKVYNEIKNIDLKENVFNHELFNDNSIDLVKFSINWIPLFDNCNDILELIIRYLNSDYDIGLYCVKNFYCFVNSVVDDNLISQIKIGLKKGNPNYKKLVDYMIYCCNNIDIKEKLGDSFNNFTETTNYLNFMDLN